MGNGRRFTRRREIEARRREAKEATRRRGPENGISDIGSEWVGSEWIDADGTRVGEVTAVQATNFARDAQKLGMTDEEWRDHMAELCERGWVRFWPEPVCRGPRELAESPPELTILILPHEMAL